ncbi:glycosyltransferase [Flavobacteriales bacterium]|nr:glycosyltransferase [Flavobacteriales bacterium]
MEHRSNRLKRLTEWWRPKAGVLLSIALFYLVVWDVPFEVAFPLLVYSIITLFGFGVLGYLLNDWADIDDDLKVGKTNLLANVSIAKRFAFLVFALLVTAFPWYFYFETDSLSWVLITTQLALLIVYPVRPFRIKRFPALAIVVDSLYAFVVPAILAWHTFDITISYSDNSRYGHFVLLGIWMMAMGLRQILSHHVKDRLNDRQTSTPNLSLSHSPLIIRKRIQSVLFPIELISSIGFFACVGSSLGDFPIVMVLVAAFFGYSQLSNNTIGFRVGFNRNSLDRFSSFWLGFFSVVMLVSYEIVYLSIAVAFLLLFSDIFFHPIVGVFSQKTVAYAVAILKFPFELASLSFNWALYYFRKWFLGWSEERNWGAHYPKRLADIELNKRKSRGTVAVFNQNYDKYTETFVRGHVSFLSYNVLSFHGWPSPIHVNNMENLVADEEFLQKAKYHVWALLNFDVKQKEDRLVAQRLMNENTDVILAEFGTMGNRLVSVSKNTGIPMVCIFYGYDAWNQDVLNEVDYSGLFDHAEKLIGVSKDICERLKYLGCPTEKIHYLPCYVNLTLFKPVKRDFEKLNMLTVGRFSSTKAPHLTILAFNEILKTVPDATLTMVGGDDGNETFEFCVSLIRSLGIGANVIMKGNLTPQEVKTCMDKATIFLQHSVTTPINGDKEGTPVAIMEAMASGLPVVATSHAGIAEMIEHGVSGILVDEFDFYAMAREVEDLFGLKNKLQSISSAAVKAIHQNELVTGHIDHIERHLAEIILRK